MLQRAIIFFSLLLACCAVLVFWEIFVIQCDPPIFTKKEKSLFPILQERCNIRKDLWIPQQKERLHIQINAKNSQLVLIENNHKLFAKEQLSNLESFSHGKTLKASKGFLQYPEGELRLDSDEIPLQLTCEQDNLLFQTTGSLFIHPQEKYIETKTPFHMEHIDGTIDANQGTLFYDRLALQQIHCEGNVRITSKKDTLAWGEDLLYTASTKMFLLSCPTPKRVLFWKEEGKFKLSAPEIAMYLNPLTKENIVRSKGDVHCSLNFEEEEIIKSMLIKHL